MSDVQARGGLARSTALHLILILLLGFLAYSNTFNSPFQFDDTLIVPQNPEIKDISNIPSFFAGKSGPFASRPLMLATLALNYRFGGLDTTGYHAVNLALHIVNAILLYFLILLTGKHLGYKDEDARLASVVSALLFTLHPLQTEGVTYITSRSMLFSATFYLLGTMLFLKAVTSESKRGLYIAGLFVASLLGMGSRENFATFPIMLMLYDLLFISKLKPKEALKHWRAYLPAILSLAYLGHLIVNNTYDKPVDYPGEGIPHLTYALTQFKVHWTYLRLFVLPVNQTVDYDYPLAGTLFELPALLSALGYAGLCAGILFLARRRPVVSFSIVWYLLILAPISFGVAVLNLRLGDVLLEHRVYLPNAGLFALAGAGAVYISRRLTSYGREILTASLVLLLLVPLTLTYSRNVEWRSEISLWSDAIEKAPEKARGYNNIAMAYQGLGMSEEALKNFKLAVEREPNYPLAFYNMGSIYGKLGMLDEAEESLLEAVKLRPNYGHAYNNLGNVYLLKGDLEKAREHFNISIHYRPDNYEARVNLALVYRQMGEHEKALEQMRIAEKFRSKKGMR
jgi:tetratricopeptide (TPR) repeat protein